MFRPIRIEPRPKPSAALGQARPGGTAVTMPQHPHWFAQPSGSGHVLLPSLPRVQDGPPLRRVG
ncbi:hypothetical protein FHS89_001633 [Rubricella aquisinus]|uniref:Uncharacterized protein n=1 Tax=Rubricella aquisinus TaxID=2028108 RepID=A0A840WM39_9RHOB|nr:hypothetical protein [Rubricella aquisinus]MBB5515621.1 hypothetical protein [Rubricella aquisinus]